MNTPQPNASVTVRKADYEKPAVELIEMEHESSILNASSNGFDDGGVEDGW